MIRRSLSPEATVKRLAASRRAHAGNATEAFVEGMSAACERAGLCSIWRVGTPMKIMGPAHRGRGVRALLTGQSCVDYLGVMAGGRALAVEVKGVAPSAKPWKLSIRDVKPQQQACLDAVHREGGVAVLLVVVGVPPACAVYPLPWGAVRALEAAGVRTLKGDLVAGYQGGGLYLAGFADGRTGGPGRPVAALAGPGASMGAYGEQRPAPPPSRARAPGAVLGEIKSPAAKAGRP